MMELDWESLLVLDVSDFFGPLRVNVSVLISLHLEHVQRAYICIMSERASRQVEHSIVRAAPFSAGLTLRSTSFMPKWGSRYLYRGRSHVMPQPEYPEHAQEMLRLHTQRCSRTWRRSYLAALLTIHRPSPKEGKGTESRASTEKSIAGQRRSLRRIPHNVAGLQKRPSGTETTCCSAASHTSHGHTICGDALDKAEDEVLQHSDPTLGVSDLLLRQIAHLATFELFRGTAEAKIHLQAIGQILALRGGVEKLGGGGYGACAGRSQFVPAREDTSGTVLEAEQSFFSLLTIAALGISPASGTSSTRKSTAPVQRGATSSIREKPTQPPSTTHA
ncbi:hypothetical protein M8818_002834 [Zalaria obscura]|uniref:Uncharacterized protein n=1 Tax=Zalaria obscura TaxID=2024903 RepID=A0ACC3SHX4_9PEZI